MDINQTLLAKSTASLSSSQVHSLKLELGQQLDAKVISTSIETQSITLQIANPKKSIQVKSNIPIETIPGQSIKLQVTKLSPTAEFKVLSTDSKKPINLKNLTLKQIVLLTGKTQPTVVTAPLKHAIINAKIIAISETKILIKLPNFNPEKQGEIAQKNTAKNHNTIIQIAKDLSPQKHVPGEKIQLELIKKQSGIEYKILPPKHLELKSGQIIVATVINIKDQQLQLKLPQYGQTITLKKNQVLGTSTNSSTLKPTDFLTLKKEQQIHLKVIKTGLQPKFKLITSSTSSEQIIQDTLKQKLPNQQQSPVLLNHIIQQLPNLNKSSNIPDTLKRLAAEIINNLDVNKTHQAKPLKHTIQNSGLFLEALLTKTDEQSSSNFHPDFKNKLLKFSHALKLSLDSEKKLTTTEVNLIKDLQQKTDNSLAKIILNQLASLPKEDASKQVWVLDLPFLNKEVAESVEIRISQDQNNKEDDTQQNWAVTITISPQGLGTVFCKVSCYNETINTRFWSDENEVVNKISQNLEYLKAQFEAAGINTGHLSAQNGPPPSESPQHHNSENTHLVNQKV